MDPKLLMLASKLMISLKVRNSCLLENVSDTDWRVLLSKHIKTAATVLIINTFVSVNTLAATRQLHVPRSNICLRSSLVYVTFRVIVK